MSAAELNLGKHWEHFIQMKLSSGQYASMGEVVREALRYMEERDQKLAALRDHLAEGAGQAVKGRYDEGYTLDGLLSELDG